MTTSPSNTLEALLEEISFRRRKDLRRNGEVGVFSVNRNTTYWTDLFVRHFLFQSDLEVDRDDLLFFIRKNLPATRPEPFLVEVFRRDSRKLPIGDPDIDWEETIYLNLIVHQLNYCITLAVCTRTSPKNLQVLRRYSHKVYATPSRRKMECKGETEEMTYPYISFTVDNFDEMFNEVVVRDGETVGIELTASDPSGRINLVLFSACVPYETIKRVYDARSSQTVRKRLSQTNLFSLFSAAKYGTSRMEYVRLVAPQGHSELAVAKVKGLAGGYVGSSGSAYGGCDTPSSEPGTDLFDQLYDSDSETEDPGGSSIIGFRKGHARRLSDPSNTLADFVRLGLMERPSNHNNGTTTTAAPVAVADWDTFGDATCEVYAGDLLDEFEANKYNPLWAVRGCTQLFHSWRESKRIQSLPLGTYVTYVALPWWSIIKDVLEKKAQPLLTF